MVRQITMLSNPVVLNGGTGIAFTVETLNGSETYALAAADLGSVLQFFASSALVFDDDEGGAPKNDLFPIPASGIGFQEGLTPDTKMVIVSVAGFGLGFEIANSDLADMATQIGQVATALSASGDKAN